VSNISAEEIAAENLKEAKDSEVTITAGRNAMKILKSSGFLIITRDKYHYIQLFSKK